MSIYYGRTSSFTSSFTVGKPQRPASLDAIRRQEELRMKRFKSLLLINDQIETDGQLHNAMMKKKKTKRHHRLGSVIATLEEAPKVEGCRKPEKLEQVKQISQVKKEKNKKKQEKQAGSAKKMISIKETRIQIQEWAQARKVAIRKAERIRHFRNLGMTMSY